MTIEACLVSVTVVPLSPWGDTVVERVDVENVLDKHRKVISVLGVKVIRYCHTEMGVTQGITKITFHIGKVVIHIVQFHISSLPYKKLLSIY